MPDAKWCGPLDSKELEARTQDLAAVPPMLGRIDFQDPSYRRAPKASPSGNSFDVSDISRPNAAAVPPPSQPIAVASNDPLANLYPMNPPLRSGEAGPGWGETSAEPSELAESEALCRCYEDLLTKYSELVNLQAKAIRILSAK